jgi:hypothetical protein
VSLDLTNSRGSLEHWILQRFWKTLSLPTFLGCWQVSLSKVLGVGIRPVYFYGYPFPVLGHYCGCQGDILYRFYKKLIAINGPCIQFGSNPTTVPDRTNSFWAHRKKTLLAGIQKDDVIQGNGELTL